MSGQGPEPFPHRVGPNGQTAARIFFLGVRWGQNRILVLFPPKNGIRFRTIEQTSEHQLDQARKAGFEIDDDNAVFDNGTGGISTRLIERPEGKRLFDKLRRGDVLVVRWVDRLGRNYDDVCETIREFMRRGVVIRTVINNMTFDGTKLH